MNLTLSQLMQCMSGLTQNRADHHLQYLNDTMEKYSINTPLRAAHFLSQLGHESGSLIYTQELASGEAYENRADLGNTEKGDGKKFKGRGFIQITGRSNYRQYSYGREIDFELHPEELAKEPYCSDSAGWFWENHSLNIFADADNFNTITRRINGGMNGALDREKRLIQCKKVLKVSQ